MPSASNKMDLTSKVCCGLFALCIAGIAVLSCSGCAASQEQDEEQQPSAITEAVAGEDGEVDLSALPDSSVALYDLIYEGRALPVRVIATEAAAGEGVGKISLRIVNESDMDLKVELANMSVCGEPVAGSVVIDAASMAFADGEVGMSGQQIHEVDNLDLWHAEVRVLTSADEEIEKGTANLAGAL